MQGVLGPGAHSSEQEKWWADEGLSQLSPIQVQTPCSLTSPPEAAEDTDRCRLFRRWSSATQCFFSSSLVSSFRILVSRLLCDTDCTQLTCLWGLLSSSIATNLCREVVAGCILRFTWLEPSCSPRHTGKQVLSPAASPCCLSWANYWWPFLPKKPSLTELP